jgi:hypothetical protein
MQSAYQVDRSEKDIKPSRDPEPSQAEPPLVANVVEKAIRRISGEDLDSFVRDREP